MLNFLKKPIGLILLLFLFCNTYQIGDYSLALFLVVIVPPVLVALYTLILYKKKFSEAFIGKVALFWPLFAFVSSLIIADRFPNFFIVARASMPAGLMDVVLCLGVITAINYFLIKIGNKLGLWLLRQQPKKYHSNLYKYDSVAPKLPEIEPPWVKFPNCNPPTLFSWGTIDSRWYKSEWLPYWNSLSYAQQNMYMKKWHIPIGWDYYLYPFYLPGD